MLLTANVGFLAIPGVVLSNLSGTDITSASEVVIFTSPSQIASSLSVVASIGSIVTGLLLVRRDRTKQKEDLTSAVSGQSHLMCLLVTLGQATYLYENSHKIFGLEPTAILFSLPWALLMWSYVVSCLSRRCTRFMYMKIYCLERMVIFFIALLLFSFSVSDVSTMLFVVIMSVLVATLIASNIWITWEHHDMWQKSLVVSLRSRADTVFERIKEFIPFCTRRVPGDGITLNSRV